MPQDENLATPAQVAEYLQKPAKTLAQWRSLGTGPKYFKLGGGHVRYSWADVRAWLAEQAVKNRDLSWSDDMGDRSARGRACGGGLGICLGIASKDVGGDSKLSSEERTEVMLDLHGLHSNEATEVLEEFVLAVSVLSRTPDCFANLL